MNGNGCTYGQYKGFTGKYNQMTHLPYITPPTGFEGSLGWDQKRQLLKKFPSRKFITGNIGVSCPPNGIRIYQTGNGENPNVYSAFGVVTAEDIRY